MRHHRCSPDSRSRPARCPSASASPAERLAGATTRAATRSSAKRCSVPPTRRCTPPRSTVAMTSGWRERTGTLLILACAVHVHVACAETLQRISIRGHEQTLHIYGAPSGTPIVLSSGDGGWMHLAPHVAEVLSEKGYFVV